VPIGLLVAGAGVWFFRRRTTRTVQADERFRVPEDLNPFTVIGLLRDIERRDGLSTAARTELAGEITRLERHYFAEPDASEPDLAGIARNWVGRAR
jgi:hypothetical protein